MRDRGTPSPNDLKIIDLISNNNEMAHRDEVHNLTIWCSTGYLILHNKKTKEIILDFRRKWKNHNPILISSEAVESVSSFKFQGVNSTEELSGPVIHLLSLGRYNSISS